MMERMNDFSKLLNDPLLLFNIFSPLIGLLLGSFITYKVVQGRLKRTAANDSFKKVYGSIYIKLFNTRVNLEIKKKELGNKKFRKFNKECKKRKSINLTTQQIIGVADDILKMVKKEDKERLSLIATSKYFAIEQIRNQISLAEISVLGISEDYNFREKRIGRLYYELACAKISFIQAILVDIHKILQAASIQDKEIKTTVRFLLKTCRNAKKKGVSKLYGIELPNHLKLFDKENKFVG